MAARIARFWPTVAHGGKKAYVKKESVGATKLFDAVLTVWGLKLLKKMPLKDAKNHQKSTKSTRTTNNTHQPTKM